MSEQTLNISQITADPAVQPRAGMDMATVLEYAGEMQCVYCGAPVYCETIQPPLCEKHYEMALLMSRCEQKGYAITPETVIQRMKAATFAVWHIAEAEVAGLLTGMGYGQLRMEIEEG